MSLARKIRDTIDECDSERDFCIGKEITSNLVDE